MEWVSWASKGLLFLAGLSAVIDLFDPKWLADRGDRIRRRADTVARRRQNTEAARETIELRRRLLRLFVDGMGNGDGSSLMSYWLVSEPPESSPTPLIPLPTLRAFWHRVSAEGRKRYPDDVPPSAQAYFAAHIDGFLREQLPAHLQPTVDRAGVLEERKYLVYAVLATLGMLLFYPVGVYIVQQQWNGILTWAAIGSTAMAVALPGIFFYNSPGALSVRLWRVWASVVLCAANLLNRNRPLHPLRIIALGLFVVGSLIDLVVSFPPFADGPADAQQ